MIRIEVFTEAKCKDSWLKEAIKEYQKRLTGHVEIKFVEVASVERVEGAIGLDPRGKLVTSEEFAREIERGGARIKFVIGGPDGLSDAMRGKMPLISLSPLTFTAQMTRLVLTEQIYRATEILKRSRYHK